MIVLDEIIDKFFNKDHIRHAYLLETNDYNKVFNIAKQIILKFNMKEDNIESLIDNGIYSDLKVIEPEGQWIKKEQVANLKSEFKVKSTYNNKRIYIIKNAENLNKSAGNTILKFLEEPEENIIALLVTSNKSRVLDTLVSRCQYILLDSNQELKPSNCTKSLNIFNILETKKQDSSFEINKIFDSYDDRNKIKETLNDLVLIYEQLMLKMLKIDIQTIDYDEEFDKIIKNNKIEDIKRRINGLILIIDSLEYNVNLRLLVDKLVIEMFGVD